MAKTLGSPRHEAVRAFLVKERQRRGLTQTDVAKKVGRYQSVIATIEAGQRRVDIVELLDLADAIGFDAAGLVRRLNKVKR